MTPCTNFLPSSRTTSRAAIYQALTPSILRPPPRLSVSEWADRERVLSPEASAEPGRWRTARAPYLKGILDAFSAQQVERVVVMSAAQVGKTEILNNVCGYFVDQDPSPILVVQPTVEMGHSWSKDRLAPMLRDTPALKQKVKDPKSRDTNNTILHKTFRGGHLTIAGANSAASLASRPVRIVLADEVDRYPASAGTEGDPLNLASKRTANFWNRKIGAFSTPTVKGRSRIEGAFEESDRRYYMVPCPHCLKSQRLVWKQVIWPEDHPERAAYACEYCGAEIEHNSLPWMLANGEWIATGDFHGVAGFHLSELYSPWSKWGEMARRFLDAKRKTHLLKTWVNTSLGETWEEQGETLESSDLESRVESYESPPAGVLVLTGAVDVQDDRLEAEIVGWGRDYESWGIQHEMIFGDPARPQVWKSLDELLLGSWETADGRQLRLQAVCIDSGGHHTQMVYRFCKPRYVRRVFAIKGVGGEGRALISRPSTNNSLRVRLFSVGVDTGKEAVWSHLKIDEPGPGYCHFPASYDAEFFDQLTAEKVVTRFKRGMPVRYWVKTRNRNEAFDLRVYAWAALELTRINLNKLADKVTDESRAEATTEPEAPRRVSVTERAIAAHRKRGPGRRSGGFVNSWRK